MLDLMRKANRQKWFLGIIVLFVVFSFVVSIFAIWGGAATGGNASSLTWAARVNGVEISAQELERQRQQVENLYRNQFGNQFEAFAGTQNFYQIASDQLMGRVLAYTYAESLGLASTEQEISQAIQTSSVFQRGGRFIGRAQYMNELRGRGLDVAAYEHEIGRDLTVEKLRDFVGTLVSVSEPEIDEEYKQRGENAEVDYTILEKSQFMPSEDPSPDRIRQYFDDRRDDYKIPEKRRASYVLIERAPLQNSVEITEEEIRDQYEKDQDRFKHAEQRRASHILFKTAPDASDEEVEQIRQMASTVLDQARSGSDFADLARQNSGDGSAASGGDLGWFSRGKMVPEFDEASFNLKEAEISDLVRSQYGYHIIKLTGTRPAGLMPIDEVHDQIKQQMAFRRAQDQLESKTYDLETKLNLPDSSFEGLATEMGYTVEDTGLFAEDGRLGKLGLQARAAREVFSLEIDGVTSAIPVPQGALFLQLKEIANSEPAPFETVQDQVKEHLQSERAFESARKVARAIVIKGSDGFKAAADEKKLTVNSIAEFNRSSVPLAFNDTITEAIFSHEAGELIGPLDSDDGPVIVRIINRGPTSEAEIAEMRARLRDDLTANRHAATYQSLLQGLVRTASIERNTQLWADLAQRASR